LTVPLDPSMLQCGRLSISCRRAVAAGENVVSEIYGVGVNLPQFDGHSNNGKMVPKGVSDEKAKNVHGGI